MEKTREIKFRAWDGKQMLHVPAPTVYALERFFGFITDVTPLNQFTGLKDKNGKEIYEGDIVRVVECECVGHGADGSEEWIDCQGEVSFEDGMFVFDGHSAGTLPMSAYKGAFEVIGNIYENPELLK